MLFTLLSLVAAASAKSPTLARFASVGFESNRTIYEICNYLTMTAFFEIFHFALA